MRAIAGLIAQCIAALAIVIPACAWWDEQLPDTWFPVGLLLGAIIGWGFADIMRERSTS